MYWSYLKAEFVRVLIYVTRCTNAEQYDS